MTTTAPGRPGVEPAAHVEGQGAHVAAAGAVDAVRDDADAVDVGGRRGELAAPPASSCGDPGLLDLLLGRAQPLDEVADAADEVVGLGLEQLR